MPDASELIEEGIRYERGGALDKALKSYQAAFEYSPSSRLTAEALRRQADVYRTQCAWDEAFAAARRSAEVARKANLPDLHADALNAEASIHLTRGEFEPAAAIYHSMLAGNATDRVRGIALQNLGLIAARQGELTQAEHHFRESSECFQRCGYGRGAVIALNNYAAVAIDRKDWDLAARIGDDAIKAARGVGDLELVAIAMLNAAEANAGRGNYAEAEELAGTALGYFGVSDNKWRRVRCLLLLGDMNLRQSDTAGARRSFEIGLKLAEEIEASAEIDLFRTRLASLPL